LSIDFHLDFDLDASWMHLDEVVRQTEAMHDQGRVTVGHVTKLSALPARAPSRDPQRPARAGVAVTVLPPLTCF
jgi:cytosine/creatinine deaminase